MDQPPSGECPAPSEVDPGRLGTGHCGDEVRTVEGGPRTGAQCGLGDYRDTGAPQPGCWYDVTYEHVEDCEYGRPFGASASPASRDDWHSPATGLPQDRDRSDEWTAIALAEHASIASFARFTLELLAHGAPADLVLDAQRAAADEVRHARIAFGLASAFAGRAIGPGPLPMPDLTVRTLAAFAAACVREGCIGETVSALRLAQRAANEPEPRVRRVLLALARDEANHAALAWRTLQWAIAVDGHPVCEAVRAALAEAPRDDAWFGVVEPLARRVLTYS